MSAVVLKITGSKLHLEVFQGIIESAERVPNNRSMGVTLSVATIWIGIVTFLVPTRCMIVSCTVSGRARIIVVVVSAEFAAIVTGQ